MTNDMIELQGAINAGEIVPPGTYEVEGDLIIPSTYTHKLDGVTLELVGDFCIVFEPRRDGESLRLGKCSFVTGGYRFAFQRQEQDR